jgi:hypothetical protein
VEAHRPRRRQQRLVPDQPLEVRVDGVGAIVLEPVQAHVERQLGL